MGRGLCRLPAFKSAYHLSPESGLLHSEPVGTILFVSSFGLNRETIVVGRWVVVKGLTELAVKDMGSDPRGKIIRKAFYNSRSFKNFLRILIRIGSPQTGPEETRVCGTFRRSEVGLRSRESHHKIRSQVDMSGRGSRGSE